MKKSGPVPAPLVELKRHEIVYEFMTLPYFFEWLNARGAHVNFDDAHKLFLKFGDGGYCRLGPPVEAPIPVHSMERLISASSAQASQLMARQPFVLSHGGQGKG